MSFIRLGALAALLLCAPFCFSQPKMFLVDGKSPDFGDIYTPATERLLTFKNIGTDTLTISNVSTSCGCTVALLSNDHIAPGGSGILSVKFEAKRFSGKVEKAISLNTNDTEQKHVSINFHANVIKSLELEPEYFFFSAFPDSTTEKTITITNSSSQTIHIQSVKPSSDFITVKISSDKLEPGDEATLTGTIHPIEAGTTRGDIEITTDFSPYPKFTVSFFAYIKAQKAKPN